MVNFNDTSGNSFEYKQKKNNKEKIKNCKEYFCK